jgi:hypothetical protein
MRRDSVMFCFVSMVWAGSQRWSGGVSKFKEREVRGWGLVCTGQRLTFMWRTL